MSENIYVKLGERINRNATRMPLIPEVIGFLEGIFSREQAELAAGLPIGAHTLKVLAKELKRDAAELHDMLEQMADEGLIFVSGMKNSENEYSLPPFAPGLIEFQFMKGEVNDRAKKIAGIAGKLFAGRSGTFEKQKES